LKNIEEELPIRMHTTGKWKKHAASATTGATAGEKDEIMPDYKGATDSDQESGN
jgi:hypothetical protein